MRELIEWTNRQLTEKTMHPLMVVAVFVYEFLSIHPFQDGNGRLSRLLTTLCLLQQEYEFIQYISFENHIERHKKDYYKALMSGQRNRNTKKERIDRWLIFFLESLKSLTEKLEQKYSVFKSKGGYLNERQKQIKDFMTKHQPLKVGDLSAHFPEIPTATLKKDLKYLREEQVVQMIGSGKGSFYILK
jgi:Fic family protein